MADIRRPKHGRGRENPNGKQALGTGASGNVPATVLDGNPAKTQSGGNVVREKASGGFSKRSQA